MDQHEPLGHWLEIVEDDQRGIERLLAHLADVIGTPETGTIGLPVLSRIAEFCVRHIQNEERIMAVMKYSGLPTHSEDHNRIFNAVLTALADCERFGELEWGEFSDAFTEMYRRHAANFDQPLLETLECR